MLAADSPPIPRVLVRASALRAPFAKPSSASTRSTHSWASTSHTASELETSAATRHWIDPGGPSSASREQDAVLASSKFRADGFPLHACAGQALHGHEGAHYLSAGG